MLSRAAHPWARHSAIASEMLLVLYQVQGELVGEPMLAPYLWPIRINDANGGRPLNITDIAKALHVPRETTRRAIARLVNRGAITKMGGGYVTNRAFFDVMDASVIKRAVDAVLLAADKLRALP